MTADLFDRAPVQRALKGEAERGRAVVASIDRHGHLTAARQGQSREGNANV